MDNVLSAFQRILNVQDFVSALGWVFASAMIVGGLLDDDYRNVLRWAFAGFVYLIFQEVARHELVEELTVVPHYASVAISATTFVTYTLGLALGWAIAEIAKRRVRHQIKNDL